MTPTHVAAGETEKNRELENVFGSRIDSTTKELDVENERKGGIRVDFSTRDLHTTRADMLFPRMGTAGGSAVPH